MTSAAADHEVVLDAETYFDQEYSLSKMATSTYIRDPRFKEHGWAVKIDGKPSIWLEPDEFRYFTRGWDWSKTDIICHNTPFDGAILAWRHDVRPRRWIDTLGMSRAVIGNRSRRHDLDTVAQLLGRPGKVKGAALNEVKGVRDPSPAQLSRLAAYARDDADDTWHIYQCLRLAFPRFEYWVLDWSVRMFTEPRLMLDGDMLADLHLQEVERKRELLDSLPYTKTNLSSNEQFAQILREHGVEPPVKTSKATGQETYAFAKNDLAFQALWEEHPEVTDLLDARLAVKSTITETRAARFRDLAAEGPWAVPLNYAGAKQTKRFSGGQKQNPQNLSARGPGAAIRQAIMAPEGHVILVIDSSNIELRTNAAIAGQWDVIDRLVSGQDEYATFAGQIYGFAVNKNDHKKERNVGKVGVLSLGYQSGAVTFRGMLNTQTRILLPIEECEDIVRTYRQTYTRITRSWREADRRVKALAAGNLPPNFDDEPPIEFFLIDNGEHFTGGVRSLFSGSTVEWVDLRYKQLELHGKAKNALTYTKDGTGWTSIYGGKVIENISQFLAREIVNWQTWKIWKETGFLPQLQVHDEIVYVVPKSAARDLQEAAERHMTGPVDWWPRLITGCESAIVIRYGDAK